jgi:hypothetical protein
MDVQNETHFLGHYPQMGDVHPREQIVAPKILGDSHTLVKGIPTTHRGRATNVEFTTQRRWIGPALGHGRFVHLLDLIHGQQFLEEPLRMLCQIRDGPCIKI